MKHFRTENLEEQLDDVNTRIHLCKQAISVVEGRLFGHPVEFTEPCCHVMQDYNQYLVPCIRSDGKCLGCRLYQAHLILDSELQKNEP